jgi:hypothetical protein
MEPFRPSLSSPKDLAMNLTTPVIPSTKRTLAALDAYQSARTVYDEAEVEAHLLFLDSLDVSPKAEAQVERDLSLSIRREMAAENKLVLELRTITGCDSNRSCSISLDDGRLVVALPDSPSPPTDDSLYGLLRGRILVIEAAHIAQQQK